jgi:hypothetical protein
MYKGLFRSRVTICVLVVIFYAIIINCGNQPAKEAADEKIPENPLKQIEARENYLKKILSRDGIWKDKARRDELNGYLIEIEKMRLVSLVPIITKKINYDYFWGKRVDMVTHKHSFPVYRTLLGIGIPAVPFIVAELKKTFWKEVKNPFNAEAFERGVSFSEEALEKYKKELKEEEGKGEKQILCIKLLRFIYGQGYYGNSMAKRRIELEIQQTKDKKAKASLIQALNLKFLKEPIYPDSYDIKH